MIRIFGLYIHIPFCVKKCDYCDFTSYSGCEALIDKYLDALECEASVYDGTEVDTVFVGGGTPSILSPSQIARLGEIVHRHFTVAPGYEFTMEANPGTITEAKLGAMKGIGANRISIGVQSFNDDELHCLGRIHNSKTAYDNVLLASKYFDNLSIDLMTALPNQTKASLLKTVDVAMSLPLKHISCYGLIIEEGTPFYTRYSDGKGLPNEDDDVEMNDAMRKVLLRHGFNRYEISNYALDGYESRHNLKYWQYDPYIGIGVSAHSFDGTKRWSNTTEVKKYIGDKNQKRPLLKGRGPREWRGDSLLQTMQMNPTTANAVPLPLTREAYPILSLDDRMSEFMFLGFRTRYGVNEEKFYALFGKHIHDVFGTVLDKYISQHLIEQTPTGYRLSSKAINISNSSLCDFV